MKARFFVFVAVLIFTVSGEANTCSGFFSIFDTPPKIVNLETQTQTGKPRYYTVRNYSRYKETELDTYLKSIKNLTSFSEKLHEINSFIPDRTRIPSEAFFVANEIIPLIEDFLKQHEVNYKIETYETSGIMKTRRSLLIISEEGSNTLNELARDLAKFERAALVIDPVELFFGYHHYKKSQGKFFDIDAFSPAYAMSFYLLLHSQRRDFRPGGFSSTDLGLTNMFLENIFESSHVGEINHREVEVAQQKFEDQFKESRQKSADHINKMIEAAKNEKGSD